MLNERQLQLNNSLESLARDLDISATDYDAARRSYDAVGQYLIDGFPDAFQGSTGEPEVYPQGSIMLGTVVKPLSDDKNGAYDIDLVCELQAPKHEASGGPEGLPPRTVKHQVGDRLKAHGVYAKKLNPEGRRCWTLDYERKDGPGFHIDVLPCVPESASMRMKLINARPNSSQYIQPAVAITHFDKAGNRTYTWKTSNPRGYAQWFADRNAAVRAKLVTNQKQALFEGNRAIYASVADVPDALVRTPLQRAIQILKRHRDYRFKKDPDYKPISIIVTTLAAQLYSAEDTVYATVMNIAEGLAAYASLVESQSAVLNEKAVKLAAISRQSDGKWRIENPVNPGENFADRWHEANNARAKAFFQWVTWVKSDILSIADKAISPSMVKEALGASLGIHTATLVVPPRDSSPARTTPPVKPQPTTKPWGV